jgi:hypothetical protein
MMNRARIAVVGGSTAGAMVALLHRVSGNDVCLFDRQEEEGGSSFGIGSMAAVSENHSGAEYPFDRESAIDCLRARLANEPMFPPYIYGGKDYSLILSADDDSVHEACVTNLSRLKEMYSVGCVAGQWPPLFGPPDEAFAMSSDRDQAPGARAAFGTPQRGINPSLFAALLSGEVRSSQIDLRFGCGVTEVRVRGSVTEVAFNFRGKQRAEPFDYVYICCNEAGIALAQSSGILPSGLDFHVGLRKIVIADMDNKGSVRTRLQLEGPLGGMWSPMSPDSSLLYSPAHFHMGSVSTNRQGWLTIVGDFLRQGASQGTEERRAIEHLAQLFPVCKGATIRRTIHKVNINTIDDPRVRRNFGFVRLRPNIALLLLPKWTMAASNALQAVNLTLSGEMAVHGVAWAEAAYTRACAFRLGTDSPWENQSLELRRRASWYAALIGFPETVADGFPGPVS